MPQKQRIVKGYEEKTVCKSVNSRIIRPKRIISAKFTEFIDGTVMI